LKGFTFNLQPSTCNYPMPAVDLARLKNQTTKLVEQFDQPDVFLKTLIDILDHYADRTMRAGKITSPVTVLPNYRTPPAVLRQIEKELSPYAAEFPAQALGIAGALWKDQHLETRLLAAALLGYVDPAQAGLIETIRGWAEESREPNVRLALLSNSLARMRNESPIVLLKLIAEWFNPLDTQYWYNGMRALIPLLADLGFDNLPPVFRIVQPALANPVPALQNDVTDLLNALYRASPVETGYFLKQMIALSVNPQTTVMLRRILVNLPEPLQEKLRESLRSNL
jgi:hypothetical protein